ncbi:cytochrome c oxidase assembly protein [Nocardioides bruguierae]|uniref:Bifunctional copper resistance protein CopD/cytochrome c oxidase assembly protein n=1 Tax=Nocardioides bruguierae TaxID=2945102 RepID=A0A9X2IFA5_9ACTN|nr:cytochrome c oxidase assembly protein [Nocardioides bruguierae]MCM0620214.1 bifunctional copper resistance protein CopD/cytochrome c oxidase assembly protein [Nocardioides bruguierae]
MTSTEPDAGATEQPGTEQPATEQPTTEQPGAAAVVSRPRGPVAGALVIAGLLVLWLTLELAGGAPVPAPEGLPDPGPLTGWGLPIVTYAAMLVGLVVVGSLLVPLLALPSPSTELTGRSVRAVLTVRRLAPVWAVLALVELVLTWSDQFAIPVSGFSWRAVQGFALEVDQGQALLVQAGLALVVAVAARFVFSVHASVWVLVIALVALLPPAFTGHSSASGSHDTAIVSLVVHVGAVGLWTGGVVALWWYLADRPRPRAVAARRFSSLAAWCFFVVAVTGVVNAAVRIATFSGWFTSDYGRAALVKVLLLVLLGVVAARARALVHTRVAAAAAEGEDAATSAAWRPLVTLTGIELSLMAAAVGLGVALSRTPPPVGEPYSSAAESLLGGPIPPAVTVEHLLTLVQPSGIGMAVVGLGGAGYVVGLVTLRRRGDSWPWWRAVLWFAGLAVVAYATMGGVGVYGTVMFSAHMGAHMLISMIAPIMLVLGNPIVLALRALPGADVPGGRGPRQMLSDFLRLPYVAFFTHPVVAAVNFVGSLYVIYLSGLFDWLMETHVGHAAMELHFLLAGYLFFEVLIGSAPLAHRLGHLARLGLLLGSMSFHAFFAVALMSSERIIGADYYSILDLSYVDLADDQRLGGAITWGTGEIPMVLVLIVLVAQWFTSDQRAARRADRRADADGDADLEAYNRMLAGLAQRDGGAGTGTGAEKQD